MNQRYIIDRIRRIAIWAEGVWWPVGNGTGFYETGKQECLPYVDYGGYRYPVVGIGDGYMEFLPDYIDLCATQALVIPEGIIRISRRAFCTHNVYEIVLPDSLLEIGSEAFLKSSIKKIVIPKNVVYIGENAFPPGMIIECLSPYLIHEGNNHYTAKTYRINGIPIEFRITNPIKMEVAASKYIGEREMDTLVIPDTITIGRKKYSVTGIDDCFDGNANIDSVVLPTCLRKIGHCVFSLWVNLTLPESIEYIGAESINGANLPSSQKLVIPSKTRYIGSSQFDHIEIVSESKYIDVQRGVLLDENGNCLAPLPFCDTTDNPCFLPQINETIFTSGHYYSLEEYHRSYQIGITQDNDRLYEEDSFNSSTF